MTEDNGPRIIFRPTEEQNKRLQNIFLNSGRYKHLSELLRHIMEIGLNNLESRK